MTVTVYFTDREGAQQATLWWHLQRRGLTLVEFLVVFGITALTLAFLLLALRQSLSAGRHADKSADAQTALRLARAKLIRLGTQGAITSPASAGQSGDRISYRPYVYREDGKLQVDARGQPVTEAEVTVSINGAGNLEVSGTEPQTLARLGEPSSLRVERLPGGLLKFALSSGHHQVEFEMAVP